MVLAFIAICLGNEVSGLTKEEGGDNVLFEKLDLFATVLSIIQNSYVEKVSSKDLIYGALQGTLSSLDPFSQFLTPEMYKEMQIDTGGKFGGVGIEVMIQENYIVIIEPLPGTPASKAGLKAGDKVIRINGEIIQANQLEDAVNKLRGPVGSKVEISVFRPSTKQYLTLSMIRENIKVQSVIHVKVLEGTEIGYIKITKFQEDTAEEFIKAVNELMIKKIKGLVIDLRNNPGGLLEKAIDMAGPLIGPKKLVVYTEGRLPEQNVKKFSKTDAVPFGLHVVILINRWTASAAEIVSGAVQDWRAGIILGENSFGKASVQSLIPLKDGAAIRLTTAKYFTPKGRMIHQKGIEPDIKASLTDEDLIQLSERMEKMGSREGQKNEVYQDNQLLTALKTLKDWDITYPALLKASK